MGVFGFAAPAGAADVIPAECYNGGGDGVSVYTGALWFEACLDDSSISDAYTAHKADAFDGYLFAYLNYDIPSQTGTPIVADSTAVVDDLGDEVHIRYTATDVEFAPGDLVDVVVERHLKGSTVQYVTAITDADTGLPRGDVPIWLVGNLGADSDVVYSFAGASVIASGDEEDPVVIAQPDADATSWTSGAPTVPDTNYWTLTDATGIASLTIGLVDYDCNTAEDALDYAQDVAVTAFYGQTLSAPGTTGCVNSAPIHITAGDPFDVVVPLSFSPAFDFSNGGYAYVYDYATFDFSYESLNTDVDGVAPGVRISGIAPSTPGNQYFSVYVESDGEGGIIDYTLVTVIVDPKVLPATGVDSAPLVGIAGVLVLVGAVVFFVGRRRANATT